MDAEAVGSVVNPLVVGSKSHIKALARKAAEEIVGEMPLYRSLQTITESPQREEDRARAEKLVNQVTRIIIRNFLNLDAES